MKYMSRIVLVLSSLMLIVSFQNCGQSGVVNLESQSGLGKVSGIQDTGNGSGIVDPDQPSVVPGADDSSSGTDIQAPPSTTLDPADMPSDLENMPVVVDDTNQSGMDPASSGSDGGKKSSEDSENDESVVVGGSSVTHDGVKADDRDDDDVNLDLDGPDYIVSEDDGSIIHGSKPSCATLNKLARSTSLFIRSSNVDTVNNYKGPLKISDKDLVSIMNFKGLLFLQNINAVTKLLNVKSMLLSVDAQNLDSMSNVDALSLMSVNNIGSISNFRGLLCLDTVQVKEISNYRGILEVSGNVSKISNFRGILKVKGNINRLENFRGVLQVDGDILSQDNVRVKIK
ncbi:MAG: hypothetical protein KDD45_06985 [Bdellovibrionales bacterium]|nr:hypothetical protein [Bdellovibrionales bacterium]